MNKVSDIELHHDSFVSLHVQLHNQLRQLILSGRWDTSSRIPSENELTAHLKVSRSTVRLALQQAELEGLIERHAGKGTFVTRIARDELRSRLIAFVTCGFDSESYMLLLNGAEEEVKANGYSIIFDSAQTHQEEIRILKRLNEEDVAGILLWPNVNAAWLGQEKTLIYPEIQRPIVLMDRQIEGRDYDCVLSDNYGGAQALMRHLVDLGHREVVFLTHHVKGLISLSERYRAYQDMLQEAGMTPHEPWFIGKPGFEINATYALRSALSMKSPDLQLIRDYLSNTSPRPTAIFALNDYIAIMAMMAVKSFGLKVPDDISIAGFDDLELSAHMEVPLTTVAQDQHDIGKRAARLLIDRLDGNAHPPRLEVVPTSLRIRGSTAICEGIGD